MYNFFVENSALSDGICRINGKDYNHIKNVLRMKPGEKFLVSCDNKSNLCKLLRFENDTCIAEIICEDYQDTNLKAKVILFQGLPKSDKMELIIQKAVELGVDEIIPVQMARCVVSYDAKKVKSKTERFNNIAESAAKQSKRTSIPLVREVVSFDKALEIAKSLDLFLVPYENAKGMASTTEALSNIKENSTIGIMIGSEGGFEEKEIQKAIEVGGKTVSLGKRILRTETASITAMAMVMLYCEANL